MSKIVKLFCILSLLCGFAALAHADLMDGLVAYYPFNGNANDVIGGNNGIAYNVALVDGPDGSANSAYFLNNNGTSYIQIPHSIFQNIDLNNNDFAIVVTYKSITFDEGMSGSFSIVKGNPGVTAGPISGWVVRGGDGSDGFSIATTIEVDSSGPWNDDGRWATSVSMAYKSDAPYLPYPYLFTCLNIKNYPVNVTKNDGSQIWGEPITSGDDLFIYGYNVIIDEIRIYDRYLTSSEVNQQQIMRPSHSPPPCSCLALASWGWLDGGGGRVNQLSNQNLGGSEA